MSPQSLPKALGSTRARAGLTADSAGAAGSLGALAIRQIYDALSVENSPTGFLPAAENTLLAASDNFTGQLGVEAISIARSRNATAVDKQDVFDADRRLRASVGPEKQAWMLALAGFLGGGAAAALISLLLTPSPVHLAGFWWFCIVVLCIFSSALFLVSYPRQSRVGRRQ